VVDQRLYTFSARLWLHQGQGGWHFLTVPPEISSDIAERTTAIPGHFGSVRVTATVGDSAWHTSLFPDAQTRTYLLPVKKSIRTTAQLEAGDMVEVNLHLTTYPAPAPR
jgi:hypothetical protein